MEPPRKESRGAGIRELGAKNLFSDLDSVMNMALWQRIVDPAKP